MKTYFLEMLLIWGAFGLYSIFPFAEFIFTETEGLHFNEGITVTVLFYLACAYSFIAIIVVALLKKRNEESKIMFLIGKFRQKEYKTKVKNTILFYVVKFFFIPLMVPSAYWYFILTKELIIGQQPPYESFTLYFNEYLFALIVSALTCLALTFYSFGYLVESHFFKSKVKSVEPTFFGWLVTIICYLPFLTLVTRIIPFYTHDMAFFKSQEITFVVRVFLLLIMSFKIWSIATLGAKCSNLTNRGIVISGPYRWVRHPHYLAKLIVWWVTFLPIFIYDFWLIGTMVFWTSIYIFRALTEENHLRSDPEYIKYCSQVKWRFIPYVF